jgi:hypothetical protein
MIQPAPWSIKGVDKETREKMKQMAQSQGMTLADFIDNLMHENRSNSKENLTDAIEKITFTGSEPHNSTPINSSDLGIKDPEIIGLSKEEHEKLNTQTHSLFNATSALSKMGLTENNHAIPMLRIDDTNNSDNGNKKYCESLEEKSIETKRNIAVLNETPKTIEIKKEKPKSTTKATHKVPAKVTSKVNKHSKIDTTQSKPDLFHRLTQKIGIETPILTQLSENNITDTIVRERQLRDFMRIQLTEMRDIMGTMFEKKVDEKLHELVKFIAGSTGNQAVQSFDYSLDAENLLKKQDLDLQLEAFSDDIQQNQHKMVQSIKQEFQSELENMVCALDKQMSEIVQKTSDNHHYEGRDISAGDIAAFASFQDTAEVLSSRMGRIEEVCVMLDGKLAQIQTYQHNNNQNHFKNFQDELQRCMQSIPEYIGKAITKNNTSNEIKEVVKILHSVSKKLSFLEQSVQNFSVATATQSQSTHDSYTSKLSDYRDDDSHDDILEAIKDINKFHKHNNHEDSLELDNDWEDSEEDKPRFNKLHLKQNIYDEDDDDYNDDDNDNINEIRKFDRNAMLKGVKNSKNKDGMRKNKKSPSFDFNNRKNLMIAGGVGIGILVIICLVLL